MPLGGASRWFLSAAIAHLAVAGLLLLLDAQTSVLAAHWDALVWLLLVGFVGCSTSGFSLHLFPTVARRRMPRGPFGALAFVATETGVVVGTVSLYERLGRPGADPLFSLAAVFFLASVGLIVAVFAAALAHQKVASPGPERRAGDLVTVPLFLVAWAAAAVAGGLFALSGSSEGPGLGWWLAGVHLFVLGHAALLVAGVSLRLVPRSLDADPPRAAAIGLATLGMLGAAMVPLGMLVLPESQTRLLTVWALPEAAFAVLLVGLLLFIGLRARTPRPQLGLEVLSGVLLLWGGGLGLWMVSRSDFAPVVTHALVNVLGFVGLMILVMWFGMIAPFQRISHAWTRRMLWGLAAAWLTGLTVLAGAGATSPVVPGLAPTIGGGLLLAVALAWGIGTVPVLFPKLRPLPGLSVDELRSMRERWSRR